MTHLSRTQQRQVGRAAHLIVGSLRGLIVYGPPALALVPRVARQ